jgi:hypothetical protein
MTAPAMVLTSELDPIVDEVAAVMTAGDWPEGIRRVREHADRLAISGDDLVRQVAARAIERGLVRPLRMEPAAVQ